MSKCAVILSGCGVYDGSEIHEASLLSYFLDLNNVQIEYLGIDQIQADCIDHNSSSAVSSQERNCLIESARIARGPVKNLRDAVADTYDFAILPGGFGAAKNLSSFAQDKENLSVNSDLERFLIEMNNQKKALGFICITPVIAAKLFKGVTCTLGLDQQNLDTLKKIGANAVQANYDDVVVDNAFKIYSTPAYMIDASISKIAEGIKSLVELINTND